MALSKAEKTKQFIIEKTAAVFNEKGYAGTSLADLMAVTNLTKGSIYGNFQNKDEVALAAFDFNFGAITNYIRQEMEKRHSIVSKLLVYPDVYRNFLSIHFLKSGCPLLNTAVEADDTHPALREKAVKALLFWRKSIERLVETGIKNNEIKSDANPKLMAVLITAIIEGAVMQAKLTNSDKELIIAMDYLEHKLLKLTKR